MGGTSSSLQNLFLLLLWFQANFLTNVSLDIDKIEKLILDSNVVLSANKNIRQ